MQVQTKEEYVNHLTSLISTPVSGIDRNWVHCVLNSEFADRVIIQTEGQELGDWLDVDPPRPEPGVPAEPDEEYEDAKL